MCFKMTTFNDIKFQWKEQSQVNAPSNGSKEIIKKINALKKKQRITNIVLLTTVMVLIGFFFYVNAYAYLKVMMALCLMIGSLLVRVILEYFSIKKLDRLDITTNVTSFRLAMTSYYKKRIRTHYIFTPIILLLYITGFVILLPFFKMSLSNGFYTYITVSGVFILLIMALFIGKQIKKELSILKEIK